MDTIENLKDNSPLRRYENVMKCHQLSSIPGSMHQQSNENALKEHQNQRLSSSDESILKNDTQKSISSIDTQSVNNILDEYEDLDCGKSTNSTSVSVTNYEILLDQRKRQQLERTLVTTHALRHGLACGAGERRESKHVFRVNQQTQVNQRSRDRQKDLTTSCKPSLINRNINSTTNRSIIDNRANKKPPPPEMMLMRRGEVQKRVDEWLSQSQNLHRESGNRRVMLARSSSSAEQKRRYCNGSTSTSESRLNATASCDDLNCKKIPKEEREVKQVSGHEVNNTVSQTYNEGNTPKTRVTHHQQDSNIGLVSSKIPQRDHIVSSFLPRRYEYKDKVTSKDKTSIIENSNEKNCRKPENRDGASKIKLANNSIVTQITSANCRRTAIKCSDTADSATSLNKSGESRRNQTAVQTHVQCSGSFNKTRNKMNLKRFEKCINTAVRTPPAPPRRDHSNQNNGELTVMGTANDQLPCSSFKPTNMTITQQNNRNIVTKSHYAASKNVEKIYEKSLQPEVIHADDLRSILSPAAKTSVYKEEDTEGDEFLQCSTLMTAMPQNYDEITRIYPEIGLEQCMKVRKKISSPKSDRTWNQKEEITSKNEQTFVSALQHINAIEENVASKIQPELLLVSEDTDEAIYEQVHNIPLKNSYEARSTLRLDRNFGASHVENINSLPKNSHDVSGHTNITLTPHSTEIDDNCSRLTCFDEEPRLKTTPVRHIDEKNLESIEHLEIGHDQKFIKEPKEEHPTVVNDVFVKNLCFDQDIPKEMKNNSLRLVASVMNRKPLNFNSVLSDDYENVKSREANRLQQCKIYVTKEEIERQRLINLLKIGDYNAVKRELERSLTLSTPGESSPICCPPCSPPPAPAAYISSVRASSRRLGGGNSGSSSPDRDPVGRLLRYLKTFYRELATRDPRHLPPWTASFPAGTLCPAHFQPELQLIHRNDQEYRMEKIKFDKIFSSVKLSDGVISEGPKRVAIEGGPGSGRTTLCLKLLHQWASQDDGPALAFLIPLRELKGNTIINYLTREFLPKSAVLSEAMAQVWRTLHLLEDRVLFILDGYDECLGNKTLLADAVDLLEARLFPDARILVTCTPNNSTILSPLVQRRIYLGGLEWTHIERLCVAYFIHNNLPERACEFLENLNIQPQSIKEFVQHPLCWIMLCSYYQDTGSLPTESNALIQKAIKAIVKKSLDINCTQDEEIPVQWRKRFEDFGKLSLACMREGRCCYTEAELRARGGGIEITRLGFLTRGFNFGQRRKPDIYTPIHLAVVEYLAAYYLASISNYTNILRRELEGLPTPIIGHLAALLGPKTHLVLNQLCPLEVPTRMIFSLLKAAGTSDGNILAICRLLGAAPGFGPAPNEKPLAPLVQTSPLELEGWSKILGSPACTLEALEVVFQLERNADPMYLNDFFNALANNESVKLVKITSLLGQELPADEAQRLAGYLKSILGKKRLNDFELVITCLEESAHDRLECVVSALCRGLNNASPQLTRLVLDMNLSGEQVSRVCKALRDCVHIQALHLPHLSCGCDGLASVAELLKGKALFALNLAGSWSIKNEDPSSSGISMGSGSGSGSSGCASSTLGTLPLNRCYSSLPRGALAAYGSLTRPATLPRLPLGLDITPSTTTANSTLPPNDRDKDSGNGSSKRNSDSVLCHRVPTMHPLPTCDIACHQGTGFHEIFNAIREPNCKLRSLNVSKCLQGGLDAGCLGETIRRARNLDAVRAAGASRPMDVMPIILALTEAPCLQLLDLSSPRLAMDDHPSRLMCHAIARNTTLRLLSLEGWTFRIEESDSLGVFSELLMCTSVRELNLTNARLHFAVHEGPLSRLGRRDDAGAELLKAAPPPSCPTIVFLRLAGFQVSVNDRLALRGPLLLPFLTGFTALRELDLSLDKSEIGGSSSPLLFIDDKILEQFFSCLGTHFKRLQTLKINYWRINLENSEKLMRCISKPLKVCNLSFIKANGLLVTDSSKRLQMEHVFIQTILANVQTLTWLCLDSIKLTENQCTSIGKCIRDRYPGHLLEISAKDIHVKSIKALVAAVEDGGRAEISYIGGSTCRIKITKFQKNGKGKKK